MSSAWERFTDQKKHQKNHSSGQTTMKKEIHEIGPEYIFMIYSNHTKRWERERARENVVLKHPEIQVESQM